VQYCGARCAILVWCLFGPRLVHVVRFPTSPRCRPTPLHSSLSHPRLILVLVLSRLLSGAFSCACPLRSTALQQHALSLTTSPPPCYTNSARLSRPTALVCLRVQRRSPAFASNNACRTCRTGVFFCQLKVISVSPVLPVPPSHPSSFPALFLRSPGAQRCSLRTQWCYLSMPSSIPPSSIASLPRRAQCRAPPCPTPLVHMASSISRWHVVDGGHTLPLYVAAQSRAYQRHPRMYIAL
jgi:hypothetical protein